jgi:hypothetical protein
MKKTIIFPDETKYVGEVKNGKPHGKGTLTYPDDGGEYIGQWKDGVQHGKGTYTYRDGSKYVGMLKDGKQHGKGTLTYPDNGGEYIGQWKNGKYQKKIMKNNWSKHSYQEDEDVLKYGSRLNSELNIKNIKANFDIDEFYKFFTDKKNNTYRCVYEGILTAIKCNDVQEALSGNTLVGEYIEDSELQESLDSGSFFQLVSKEMSYIPIASLVSNFFADEPVRGYDWSIKIALIFFKKSKKYIMVRHEVADELEELNKKDEYGLVKSFKLIQNLSKKNKDLIERSIIKEIKSNNYSPREIYLNNIIEWNIKNLLKILPNNKMMSHHEVDILNNTKIWLIDYKKDFQKQILKKEDFKRDMGEEDDYLFY